MSFQLLGARLYLQMPKEDFGHREFSLPDRVPNNALDATIINTVVSWSGKCLYTFVQG